MAMIQVKMIVEYEADCDDADSELSEIVNQITEDLAEDGYIVVEILRSEIVNNY